MPTLRRVDLDALLETPWAILPRTLSRIVEVVRAPAQDGALVALEGKHAVAQGGAVAVLPVYGVIEHRSDWMTELFGGTSVDGLRAQLRDALADPAVRAVVLDVDSPGGTVAGVTELAAEIRGARGGAKPIVAVVNSMAASAAYWLASQADEIVVTPSGSVGGIGVYAVHADVSRALDAEGVTVTLVSAGPHKVDGNEYEPLSEEARADLQSRVDAAYHQFVEDVAAGRRVSAQQVEDGYGGGRVVLAKKALAAGMVDRVETLAQAVQRLGTTSGRRRALAAEGMTPATQDALAAAEEGALGAAHITAMALEAASDQPHFADRLAALEDEAAALVAHAEERARLRSKEGRPAFSTTTERSLRSIRASIDALLASDEPPPSEPPEEPDEPAPEVPAPPPVAASVPARFRSREDWLRHLEARH